MLVIAGDNLLVRVNHLRVGRLSGIVPARRMQAIAELSLRRSGAGWRRRAYQRVELRQRAAPRRRHPPGLEDPNK